MSLFKRRSSLLVTVLCALISISVFVPELSTAQTVNTRYFPQTGHYAKGAFLSFWERNGGVRILVYLLLKNTTVVPTEKLFNTMNERVSNYGWKATKPISISAYWAAN